jgi:sepiapterin reductase
MSKTAAQTSDNGLFKYRTFCLITGASKGYGRALATRFASLLPQGSVLYLVARSAGDLGDVKTHIETNHVGIKVATDAIDLAEIEPSAMGTLISKACLNLGVSPAGLEQAMVIHNAASLGNISKLMSEFDDRVEVSGYFDLNVTAVVTLNSKFLQHFSATPRKTVINISSICSLQPFKSWALYCAG